MLRFLGYVVIGALAGTFSGFFGIGGGIVAIPLLVMTCAFPQKLAQGTSAFMILPTVMAVGFRYFRGGNADPVVAIALAIGAIPLAYVTADLAQNVPEIFLRRGFALLLVAVAAQLWLTAPSRG
ncbi:MAG: sulfite exporter TauE/SafE family protein [Acidobacteria bacterium]|nr:sulfite exporter TauE/SafE family protein [Acidobacteriota bacterium]